jgi:hypothetical protein
MTSMYTHISYVQVFNCRDSTSDWSPSSAKEIDSNNKELQDTANELLKSVNDPRFTYSKVSSGINYPLYFLT